MNAVHELQGRSGHWRAILSEEWQLIRDYCDSAACEHPFTRIETVTRESLKLAGIPLPGIELFLPGGTPREALHLQSPRYEALVTASHPPPKILQLRPGPNLYRGFPVADLALEWKHDGNLEPSPREDRYVHNVADEWASVFQVRSILSCPTFQLRRERPWIGLVEHVAKHHKPALLKGRDLEPIRRDILRLSQSWIWCEGGHGGPLQGPEPLVSAFVAEVAPHAAAHPLLFSVMPPDRQALARQCLVEAYSELVFPLTPEEEMGLVTGARQDLLALTGIDIPANYTTWEAVSRCIANRIYPLIDHGHKLHAVRALLLSLTNRCLALSSPKTPQEQLKYLLECIRGVERLRDSSPVSAAYRLEDLLPPSAQQAMNSIWDDENQEFLRAQQGY